MVSYHTARTIGQPSVRQFIQGALAELSVELGVAAEVAAQLINDFLDGLPFLGFGRFLKEPFWRRAKVPNRNKGVTNKGLKIV